ncbi:uncharacterized protein AMSG_01468 [Thecamonas trahens ATCC 50062]|uniref:Uncharacterized protein n=1 Tax=Thecamonas trahens ATCC 50062 TaxID=461836 RepID=A0A0L0DQP5_THETB|nr:hypothetical protein AMSG_01468 [Thecamonas trahens ATCC 50062]KNC54614.1 hypothetical protein AMSG_01468 [Thecamonas trahens ATCC 50062]|eukprot:XP_013761521.1 hypothetical protein AMSG_01468 [Thecamonas trahens ATCC 50062]
MECCTPRVLGTIGAVLALLLAYRVTLSRTGLVSSLLQDTALGVVSRVCSHATQTEVTIDDIYIHPTVGAAGLRGVTVGVPEGFTKHPASMGNVSIVFEPATLVTGSVIRVLSVVVDAPQIVFEMNKRGNSVRAVYDAILQYSADRMRPFMVIEELVIRRGLVTLVASPDILELDPSLPRDVRLPRIHLSDIGVPSGLSFSGIFKHVADPLIINILATAEGLIDRHRATAGARADSPPPFPPPGAINATVA